MACKHDLWLLRPAGRDLLSLVAGHPNPADLRAGGPRLVSDLIRRLHVADHPRFEGLALPVDHVLELARENVEHLDRAVRVFPRIGVRRKAQLSDGYLG